MSKNSKRSYADLNDSSRKVRKERSSTDYKELPLDQQIYKKPGTYIGSVHPALRKEYIYDKKTEKFKKVDIDLCEGIIRLIFEIFGNCADNIYASRVLGVDPGTIEVTMDEKRITIRSGGEPIFFHVKQELSTPKKCVTIIDRIFGILLTSSNYDDDVVRMGGGTNGFGAKLANIFSKWFQVKIGDPIRGFEHTSTWINNMSEQTVSESTPAFVYDKNTPCTIITQKEERDPKNKKKIRQKEETVTMPGTWVKGDGKKYKGDPYVEVSLDLDFARFGLKEFTKDHFKLFQRMLIDTGLASHVKTVFNGKKFDIRSIEDYAKLIFTEDQIKTCVKHYEWDTPDNTPPSVFEGLSKEKMEKMIAKCPTIDCVPKIEIWLFDTPNRNTKDDNGVLAFVNGLITAEGGVHVDAALDVFFHKIVDTFNNGGGFEKNKRKPRKPVKKVTKDGDKKVKEKQVKLTIRDIRPHVSVIMVCRFPDTDYKSQSKTILTRPTPSFHINDEILKPLQNWELITILKNIIDAKNMKLTDVPYQKGRAILKKVSHANDAGGPNSKHCVMYLGEGDSAVKYANIRIMASKHGRDRGGFFPCKGKGLNSTNHSQTKVWENEEFKTIKAAIGLELDDKGKGLDYTIQKNRDRLKYGLIIINADADDDGIHIIGLLLLFFYNNFPTLFTIGMIGFLRTPTIKLFKGKKIIHRFQPYEYEKYKEENPDCKLTVEYYKGLGSSEKSDIIDDLTTAPTIFFLIDDLAPQNLDMVFNNKKADERKQWIQDMREETKINNFIDISLMDFMIGKKIAKSKEMLEGADTKDLFLGRNVTDFLMKDMVSYTVSSLIRAIPSYKDGLKKVQRQLLYYMLGEWGYGHSKKKHEIVSSIAGTAKATLYYHHGQVSMEQTLVKMAQVYTGSNNLNICFPKGQFGNRTNFEPSQSRYIYSKLSDWVQYAVSKEMVDLVKRNYEEGKPVEPIFIPFDLPMHVINGVLGMGTGHSTFMPSHHPMKVIKYIKNKLKDKPNTKKLIPYYDGFRGAVKIVDVKDKRSRIKKIKAPVKPKKDKSSKKDKDEKEDEEEDDEGEEEIDEVSDDDDSDAENEEDIEGEEEEDDEKKNKYNILKQKVRGLSVRTEGIVIVNKVNKGLYDLTITELPIGKEIIAYKDSLDEMRLSGQLKDYKENHPDEHTPLFHLFGFNPVKPETKEEKAEKKKNPPKEGEEKKVIPPAEWKEENVNGNLLKCLKLTRTYTLCNMNVIDDKGFPMYCKTIEDVIDLYYDNMIKMYKKLIVERIKCADEELVKLKYLKKLIKLINDGSIIVVHTSKKAIMEKLAEYEIPEEIMKPLKIYDISEEDIPIINKKIEDQKGLLEDLKTITPETLWYDRLIILEKYLEKHGCIKRE